MVEYKSTKIDTGSIMDGFIIPQLLKEWTTAKSPKAAFRTVLTLSPIDKANIAFTHPGKTLNPEFIKTYGKALHYSDDTVATLTQHYQAGDLAAFRSAHHNALKGQEDDWWVDLNKDVDEEIKKILDTRTHAPRPPPILRAEPNPDAAAPSTKYDAGLLGAVYTALSNAFGPQGSQFLSLQFPTRYLSKDEFAFDLNGVYSNFVKPVTVAEAEARLVDALYDPAPIVGGPNGKSLSTVYGQALNNLVPRYEPEDKPAREQRERMRAWLLTEIGDQNPFYKLEINTATGGQMRDPGMSEAANKALLASNAVKMRKMTRMEFANQLTQGDITDLLHV